ncbi:hypothetical protein GCM10010116_08950 [Microbispora rosea subsp. aerata]|nr:hypothetical protein GCM10010116_08950 [Microbispora rosea subsp. aerata]GIH56327.1 hypothetical protein Mro02_32410 [Microbispora rosea subsp. aerata]GLJ82232.1 hypothetical protein GCM10017588_09570 [Microbispora rosea subsp. aerata]
MCGSRVLRKGSTAYADRGIGAHPDRVRPSVAGARWAVSPARYGTRAVPGRRDVQPRRAIDLHSR